MFLEDIYELLYGPIDAPGRKANLQDLAARLSRLARRDEPWKWRYLSGVIKGYKNVKASAELNYAIGILAATLDGQNEMQARAREVMVYTNNGLEPGTWVFGHTINCAYPPCTIKMVRTHPRLKYCPMHKRPKDRPAH